jgi:hypothetical protein
MRSEESEGVTVGALAEGAEGVAVGTEGTEGTEGAEDFRVSCSGSRNDGKLIFYRLF